MAKVTITIEDAEEDGKDGMIIGWTSDSPEDEDSLANNHAAAFIDSVCKRAETVTDLSGDAPDPSDKH